MNTCSPDPNESYTYNYQKHEPSGFCLSIKGLDGMKAIFKPIIYTKNSGEEDIAAMFDSKIAGFTHKIHNDFYRRPKTMKMTEEQKQEHYLAIKCHICGGDLEEDKVRDHCHFTGQYRGAAHNSYNLQCRKPLILPVILHNLQGYDAHFLIKQFAGLPGELN